MKDMLFPLTLDPEQRLTAERRRVVFKATVVLRGMKMAEAVRLIGVSPYHLSLVLSGERKGSRLVCHRIAKFLGLSVDAVFGPSDGGETGERSIAATPPSQFAPFNESRRSRASTPDCIRVSSSATSCSSRRR